MWCQPMCHHHPSDWLAERAREREIDEDSTEGEPADEELTGPGFNEPAIEAVTMDEPEVETPDLDDERAPSDD